MDPEGLERRLAAILSADAVGYSRLMAEHEDAAIRTVTAYREQFSLLAREHHGRVVDSPGDNVLAEFPSALDAVRCALELQGVLAARNAQLPNDRRMQFRMGIHVGDVRADGERLYGDGVNIAARLEPLADPGGICLSGHVHDLVSGKLPLESRDLGPQTLKNIAEPVRAFAVRARAEATAPEPGLSTSSRAWPLGWIALFTLAAALFFVAVFLGPFSNPLPPREPPQETLPLPDRPSIAVLPFANMSGDPEQEYFADGISEDLITDLSKVSGLFVIARNSSFTYKGQNVDVKQVGRDLGVGYVLEGSVRRADDRLRITAQLVETQGGSHVWADRYDRDARAIFEVQDEVTHRIVEALKVSLTPEEKLRLGANPGTENMEAQAEMMRGLHFMVQSSRESNARAVDHLERAIQLDPEYARPYAYLAIAQIFAFISQLDMSPETIEGALAAARRAVEVDPEEATANATLAFTYGSMGRSEESIEAGRRAVEFHPGAAVAHWGLASALLFSSQLEEGLEELDLATRLDPMRADYFRFQRGNALWQLGQAERAAAEFKGFIEAFPRFVNARAALAGVCADLGRTECARAQATEVRRLNPDFRVDQFVQATDAGRDERSKRLVAGMRAAGLP
ncbi:MAG: adenylate/guanylate cyclase domain-containing protein [Deltaproteobacteria bacterium]|nr:adenylate/guanylate cyclase domain-containing protein [Deltaproteobacteria bacterium]